MENEFQRFPQPEHTFKPTNKDKHPFLPTLTEGFCCGLNQTPSSSTYNQTSMPMKHNKSSEPNVGYTCYRKIKLECYLKFSVGLKHEEKIPNNNWSKT